jgi:hypothetical protein
MKKITVLSLAFALVSFTFSSCKKREVADVTITYEVLLSNPARTATMTYVNSTGGNDLDFLTTSSFTKSYTVKSSSTKVNYDLYLTCYSKIVSGTPQPQTIIINIKEDDKVIKTLTKSGTASIYINNGDISASLPSATKYK